MGQIRVVLLFNEENERQKKIGEYLKTQKRCKTALITELVYAWLQRKNGSAMPNIAVPVGEIPHKSEEEIVQRVKQELLADEAFLTKITEHKKSTETEQTGLRNNEMADTQENDLDMDEDMLMAGLSLFEKNF